MLLHLHLYVAELEPIEAGAGSFDHLEREVAGTHFQLGLYPCVAVGERNRQYVARKRNLGGIPVFFTAADAHERGGRFQIIFLVGKIHQRPVPPVVADLAAARFVLQHDAIADDLGCGRRRRQGNRPGA